MPLVNAGQRITSSVLSTTYAASDIGAVTVTQAAYTDLTGTFTVPANDAQTGNIYEIEMWGNGTWGSTQQQLFWQVVFGGNAMTSINLAALYLPASELFRFRLVGRVICLSTGSTGTFSSLLHGELSDASNPLESTFNSTAATGAFVSCESTSTTTIDTTSAQGLKVQAKWASTTGAPTITKRNAIQRKLGIG